MSAVVGLPSIQMGYIGLRCAVFDLINHAQRGKKRVSVSADDFDALIQAYDYGPVPSAAQLGPDDTSARGEG